MALLFFSCIMNDLAEIWVFFFFFAHYRFDISLIFSFGGDWGFNGRLRDGKYYNSLAGLAGARVVQLLVTGGGPLLFLFLPGSTFHICIYWHSCYFLSSSLPPFPTFLSFILGFLGEILSTFKPSLARKKKNGIFSHFYGIFLLQMKSNIAILDFFCDYSPTYRPPTGIIPDFSFSSLE